MANAAAAQIGQFTMAATQHGNAQPSELVKLGIKSAQCWLYAFYLSTLRSLGDIPLFILTNLFPANIIKNKEIRFEFVNAEVKFVLFQSILFIRFLVHIQKSDMPQNLMNCHSLLIHPFRIIR